MRPFSGFLILFFLIVFSFPVSLLSQVHVINDNDRYRGIGIGGAFSQETDLISIELSQAGDNKNAGGLGLSTNFSSVFGFAGYFERLLLRGGDKIKPSLSAFGTGGIFFISKKDDDKSYSYGYGSEPKSNRVYTTDFQTFAVGMRMSFLIETTITNMSPYISLSRSWLIRNTKEISGWPMVVGLDVRLNPHLKDSPVIGISYSMDETDNAVTFFHLTVLTRLFDRN